MSFPQKRSCFSRLRPADTPFLNRLSLTLFSALFLSSCYAPDIELNEILNYTYCRNAPDGARWVDFNELIEIRGLDIVEGSLESDGKPIPMMVVGRGVQPSQGYAITFASAAMEEYTLNVFLDWEAPQSVTELEELETSPCIVLGIEATREVDTVSIYIDETMFAELPFAAAKLAPR